MSVVALIGWATDTLDIARVRSDFIPMAPSTAICFLLLSVALFLRGRWRGRTYAIVWLLLAGAVLLIGFTLLAQFLIESVSEREPDFEQWLVQDTEDSQGFTLGRMSPLAALLFILLAISTLMPYPPLDRNSPAFLIAQGTATAVFAFAFLLLIGYWYGSPLLYGGEVTPVALTTAIAFLLLSIGITLEQPQAWLARWLCSRSVAARFTRAVVPAAIAVILIAGWLHQRTMMVEEPSEFTFLALVTAGIVALLTFIVAQRIQGAVDAGEQSLRERMDFAEGLIESSAAWIWQTDADLNHTYTNSFVTSCLGYRPDDFMRLDMLELIHPDDRDLMRLIVYDASSAKKSWSGQVLRWRHKDGSWRHIETSGSPLHDASGAFIGLQGVDRDVTERVEADAALRASEERLRRSQEISHIGSWELDVVKDELTWSDEVYRIFGFEPQQFGATYEAFLEAVHPEDRQAVDEAYSRSLREGRDSYEIEHRIIRKDDAAERIVHEKCEHIRDESGKMIRSVGMVHDITERKKAEETIIQRSRDLAVLIETGKEFTTTLHLDAVLQVIVDSSISLSDLDTGAVYLLQGDDLFLGATTPSLPGNFPEELRHALLADHPHIKESVETREPVVLDDVKAAELTAAERAVVEARGLRSIIYVPLLVEARALGCLILGTTELVHSFSRSEIDLFSTLSSQAAMAIDNSSLFEKAQKELEDRKRTERALEESESLLRQSQVVARIGHYVYDITAGTWTSSAMLDEILGIEANYGRTVEGWLSLIHPDDREMMGRYLAEHVLRKKQPFDREYRIRRVADGSEQWVHGLGQLDFDAEGAPIRLFGTIQDITERIRAQETVKESEQRYRSIFNDSPIAIWEEDFSAGKQYLDDLRESGVTDLRDYLEANPDEAGKLAAMVRVIDINEASVNAFGADSKEQVARDLTHYFTEESVAVFKEEIIALFEGHMTYTSEAPLMNSAGERLIFDMTMTVQPGHEDTLDRILVSFVDITERTRAEEALRESERRFRNIVDTSPMGMHMYELLEDGRLVFTGANPAADLILGVDNAQFVGMTIEAAFPPLEHTEVPERYRDAARNGTHWYTEQIDYDEGMISGAFEVYAFQTEPMKMVALFNDVTRRKQAEEEHERLREQLAQAQRMESVGRLAGGVAHDFNNMLGVIMGHAEIARERFDASDPLVNDLDEIYKAARHSADLTRQLLGFARRQATSPKVLKMDEIVGSMLGMLRRMIGEEIELEWQPQPDTWHVQIDPSQVDQLLVNLLVNARDAIEGAGRVKLTIENATIKEDIARRTAGLEPGDYVKLTVSDDGSGMSEEVITHAFEPFYTTKSMAEGTGLGLATVYGIVKQNDGYISVESDMGKGTTFEIFLPRHRGETKEVAAGTETPVPGKGEAVLLVEDEPTVLKMTETMLRRLGYEVLTALNSEEAMELARTHGESIDLLLTDVVMPGMSGRELADRFHELNPTAGCLFMSGYTADVISDHGVIDDDTTFLQKPFTAEKLSIALSKAMKRGKS